MRQRRMQMLAGAQNPFEQAEEDLNPSNGLANLADCMLVLACGLMVALVVAYNVDLPDKTEMVEGEKVEVDNVENITNPDNASGDGYTALGTVYQDPDTGKMYLITESGDQQEVSGSQTTNASGSGRSN